MRDNDIIDLTDYPSPGTSFTYDQTYVLSQTLTASNYVYATANYEGVGLLNGAYITEDSEESINGVFYISSDNTNKIYIP
jgi:hypothetical protein